MAFQLEIDYAIFVVEINLFICPKPESDQIFARCWINHRDPGRSCEKLFILKYIIVL